MRNVILSLTFSTLLSTALAQDASENRFWLQAGAFTSYDSAQKALAELKPILGDQGSITTSSLPNDRFSFRVLAGVFGTRNEAETAKKALGQKGLKTIVRIRDEIDAKAVDEVFSYKSPDYFLTPTSLSQASEPEISLNLKSEITAINARPTTDTSILADIENVVAQLPESRHEKAPLVLRHARLSPLGKNPYGNEQADISWDKATLLAIASGPTAATPAQRFEARQLVARATHYFDRDRVSALRAYKHLLRDAKENGDEWAATMLRLQIGAAAFELTKDNSLSSDVLQQKLLSLWRENLNFASTCMTSTSALARRARWTTARLELMVCEMSMQQGQWEQAKQISDETISKYGSFKECQDEVAESYCHQAHIAIENGTMDECYAAVQRAIEIAEARGKPIWGDPARDVLWKAYAWRITAAMKFGEPIDVINDMKAQLARKFPGHPKLSVFLGNDGGPN